MPISKAGSVTSLITENNHPPMTWYSVGRTVWLAQTFQVTTFAVLFRILVLRSTRFPGFGSDFHIRATDPITGAPIGPNVYSHHLAESKNYEYHPGKLVQLDFDFPPLVPALWALIFAPVDSIHYDQYEYGATTLPIDFILGKAWRSTDEGQTWLELPDTDFIFSAWGYTPPPDPPPPPVTSNWFITDIQFFLTTDGVMILCTTNVVCHLFLRWTKIPPQQHMIARVVRGAPLGSFLDQCLVAYTDLEQAEEGDTLTHTFLVEPWPTCETRWFYFWGTRAGALVPSASPIFQYHRTGLELPPFAWSLLLTETWEGPVPQEGFALLLWERWTIP